MRPLPRYYPVAVPEFEPPPKVVREHIGEWYDRHAQQYAKVWERLDQIRQLWNFLDHDEQVAMLQTSAIFAIYTILTPTPLAEAAFDDMMHGTTIAESRKKDRPIPGAPAGKHNQMPEWIYKSLVNYSMWDQAVSLLNSGHVDTAHKLLVDESTGLGSVKAGFTLAQLGFVQKMCIDGNLARLFGASQPETVDISKYEGLCADIRAAFPDLSEKLEPYQLQWLLFDWQRAFRSGEGKVQRTDNPADPVATHDEWFKYALGDPAFLVRRMQELTRRAVDLGYGDPPPGVSFGIDGPPMGDVPEEVFEDIEGQIDDAIESRL